MSATDGILKNPAVKFLIYTGYNLEIGALAVGLARLIISVAHIGMHWLNKEAYKQAYENHMEQFKTRAKDREEAATEDAQYRQRQLDRANEKRAKENDKATEKRQQAKGPWETTKALAKEGATKLINGVQDGVQRLDNATDNAWDKVSNTIANGTDKVEKFASEKIGKKVVLKTFEQEENEKIDQWKDQAIRGLVEVFVPFVGAWCYTGYDLYRKDVSVLELDELQTLIDNDDKYGFKRTLIEELVR